MTLYVGTSGWAYREWKPDFYPAELPQNRFLEFYGNTLSACEINATFYRLQAEQTFERWLSSTPPAFRFAVKAHRRLTHSRQMAPDRQQHDFLDVFLRSLSTLGERLGAVLFQFPPRRERDDDQLESLLRVLPRGPSYAFEFRHDSWIDGVVRDRLVQAGATVCISDSTGTVPEALPPGPIAYVRLRAERYTDETREAWARLLQTEAKERDVYAFTKHEGAPPNDPYTGVGLARWLLEEVA
ncbi:MAG: DUF72 domain-containing protein [Actinomycetota bacterium]|nr:DUF72 domain-containing protein [Actinomycetota bacterium]